MLKHIIQRNLSLVLISILLLGTTACDFGSSLTPEEHMEKARAFITEGKNKEGVIELKNALQLESNLPEARWMLGKIYLEQGNAAAAYKEINQAQSLGFSDPELGNTLLQAMLLQGKNQDVLDKTHSDEVMSVPRQHHVDQIA